MHKDVETFVRMCQTCMRNNKETVEFHPAIAITADSVWDNLVVDTTWGYPLTVEGYHGLLTVIDRVSHFPFAWALKSKNASEIAEKIFDLICSLFAIELVFVWIDETFPNHLLWFWGLTEIMK